MADNFTFKDGAGATRTMGTKEVSGVNQTRTLSTMSEYLADVASSARVTSAASNNATSVSASPAIVYGLTLTNLAGTTQYLKLYNKASAPAPATDNALLIAVIPIPGSGLREVRFHNGLAFSTGLAYAIVAGVSDTDNTNATANGVMGNISWKAAR